jgi:hypothetical protein
MGDQNIQFLNSLILANFVILEWLIQWNLKVDFPNLRLH